MVFNIVLPFVSSFVAVHVIDQVHKHSDLHIEGVRPEWYISTMIYCQDTPVWSETFDIFFLVSVLSQKLYILNKLLGIAYARDQFESVKDLTVSGNFQCFAGSLSVLG